MNLNKKDFSCWGNGDKYDDELFISHDPKITAVEIADEILKNQKIVKELKYRKKHPMAFNNAQFERWITNILEGGNGFPTITEKEMKEMAGVL